jgi:predicted nuclease of predicted toxin-antitoxin system
VKGYLLDENLPQNITFTPALPFTHARDLGVSVSDSMLWQHARANQLVIVSKDADFSHRIMLASPPPWVVHLRFGNLRGRDFHGFLARAWPSVEALLPANKLVNVYSDRIEAVSA